MWAKMGTLEAQGFALSLLDVGLTIPPQVTRWASMAVEMTTGDKSGGGGGGFLVM